MKVGSDATHVRPSGSPPRWREATAVDESAADWISSPLVAEALKRLPGSSNRFIACAPGRLDVMGGLAEYTGALVVNMPIREHVYVGAQRRRDDVLSITSLPSRGLDGAPTLLAVSQLFGAGGGPIDLEQARKLLDTGGAPVFNRCDARWCVLGTLVEMVRAGLVARPDGGLSIVVGSTLTELTDAAQEAAMAAATLVAVAGAYDVTLDPLDAAALCQRVENTWLNLSVGIGNAVCVLLGEASTLTEVRCEPCPLAGTTRLPGDLVVIGIDCSTVHPEANLKYARARTAVFMGRGLIDRIIQYEGAQDLQWDGYLSRVSVTDYVDRFRDRLPTKLKGSEYLQRFGETGDSLTQIDPNFVYRIRSRTEHHIYEHARACQFIECLSRAIRNGDEGALREAGELMYASHWSYGQRCGLGSAETDLLVSLIREHGTSEGVYGAKITGRGCGGVVAVLMRASDRASEVIGRVASTYESRTGHTAKLIRGSSPGALVRRVRRMEPAG